ncbi:MAG: M48 family metallopeptidase [Candidatus Omnitrophota bacterium]|jgi:STE24 endopeptidase
MRDSAKQYSTIKHRIALANIFMAPAMLWLFLSTGIASYFKNTAQGVFYHDYASLAIFYVLTASLFYVISLPLEFYSGFTLEHRFSLSNQALKGWLAREAKKNLVTFAISLPLVMILYAFLKSRPFDWWLWTAVVWFLVSIMLAKLAPIIIVPIFYKYSPIKDAALKERMNRLIAKTGFKTGGVYELDMSKDTKKANAALLGMGKQKRIVLCDTLISNFSPEEIESVMAHELGHHKLNHIWKLVISGGIFTLITFFLANELFLKLHGFFGYRSLYDYESLILIGFAVSVFNAFLAPLANAFSRRLEKDADEFSIKITGDASAFISAMKKLGEQNLADAEPGKFYEILLYDHPPISRRIALAESLKSRT